MKIGVDVRCLMDARRTGVEEYTLNLLLNLFEIDQKNDYVLFFNSWKEPAFNFSIFLNHKNVQLKRFKIPNKLLNLCFWYLNWPKIDKMIGGADIFFMPNIIFGSLSKDTKLILTIHDLSFERCPEHYSWKRRLWHIFINPKKMCERADKIIAVSDSTKNDLISLYNEDSKKIITVFSAVSDDFKIIDRNDNKLIELKEKYKLPYRFILYFGTIEPRKNIQGIIRAYDELMRHSMQNKNDILSKYELVIAGEKGWLSEQIFTEINKSKFKEKIRIINSIPNEEKTYLYNLAALFVYPSFFEGFGFPPLEAMKCGIPVVVSNNSSLPEVVGKGAIMIDPAKPNEIFAAMKEILLNNKLREMIIVHSRERAGVFDWKNTAAKYLDIINKMV